MQILNSSYSIHPSNYNKRTPAILRYIADFIILVLMPAGDGILAACPPFESKEWFMFGWTTFCVLFKATTKFISDFPKPEPSPADIVN
jgi:hypothetical protein